MSDKEKAAEEYANQSCRRYEKIGEVTDWCLFKDSFLAGVEWAEKRRQEEWLKELAQARLRDGPEMRDFSNCDKLTQAILTQYHDMVPLQYAELRTFIDGLLRERDEEWLKEMERWYEQVSIMRQVWTARHLWEHMQKWAKGER